MNHPAPAFFADVPLPPMGPTASGRPWRLREADPRAAALMVQNECLDPLLARVLAARGVSASAAEAYLHPKLRDSLPDPFVLKDMDAAAAHLANAVLSGRRIGIFGDYDVDGVSASALLTSYFGALGLETPVYLPDRIAEGYGPSIEAFSSLKDQGAETIITVDCGAAAHGPVNAAAEAGLDVVVLDHHLMSGPPPDGACAIVNPNRPDDISGLSNLSAAGVAFMATVALNRALREAGYFETCAEPALTRLLDLAALGLVCDVMEMTGLARVLVAQGLKVMEAGGNPGLRLLADRAGAKGRPSAYHLGFLAGPRINAAGRIGHARLAFELLTTRDPARRQALAEKLHLMNAQRQEIEAGVLGEAVSMIERNRFDADDVILAAGEGWHPGVVGIVAGRIREKYDKPAVIIGLENSIGKGSGRSMSGVDLGAAVAKIREQGLLIAGGGHAMAAGLTVAADQVDACRTALNAALASDVEKARASRSLSVDAVIGAEAVTASFAAMIEEAGPFGPGNPEPLFALTDMRVCDRRTVGANHLALGLKNRSGQAVRAIAFRAEGEPLGAVIRSATTLHLAGKVRADDWRGGEAGQLQVVDAAPV